jgi:bifunctional DNase/RNase
VDVKGTQIEIDSRPSDAIALAVRVKTPIFVADVVMDKAAIQPDEDVEKSIDEEGIAGDSEVEPGKLSAFADFVDTLDLDDLEDSDD